MFTSNDKSMKAKTPEEIFKHLNLEKKHSDFLNMEIPYYFKVDKELKNELQKLGLIKN